MNAPRMRLRGMSPDMEALVWACAMRFVITDSRAAFETITAATWAMFLTALGWSSVTRDLPSGRIAYWRCGDGVTVRVYEGAFDHGTRLDDTARRLAQALGIPTDLLVAQVLVLQHAHLCERAEPVVVATVDGEEVKGALPLSVTNPPSERAVPRRPAKSPPPLEGFLATHPALLDVLCEVGRREVARGARRIDVRGLFRLVRECPDLAQRVRPQGGRLGLNHYHTPDLGRLILAACPDLAPFLRLRKRALEGSMLRAEAVR